MAELSPIQQRVLESRYLQPGETKWEHVVERVVNFVGQSEPQEIKERFFEMLLNFWFVPNSPTLMNAGTTLGDLCACYVLPIHDNMESIFTTLYDMAMIQKCGGGTGFDFSELRPKGSAVSSTQGVASGPVSFLNIYNAATAEIKQGGRRRGANMAVLRYDHPDIMDFITAKHDPTKLTNFNLSVAVTDTFMQEVTGEGTYFYSPDDELFKQITESAWGTGDPGLLFIDTANRSNPVPSLGRLTSTNPCGESWLLPYESCVLGALNLSKPEVVTNLHELTMLAVRFLDDIIDVTKYASPKIEEATRCTRKIGLGVMGFADYLIQRGIPYSTERARQCASSLMGLIQTSAYMGSALLAAERGIPDGLRGLAPNDPWSKRRNAQCTIIAPTGTTSMLAGCSSGIEPLYSLVTVHEQQMEGDKFTTVNIARPEAIPDEVWDYVLERGCWPKTSRLHDIYRTAHEVSWRDHVAMQAAFQMCVDNAVSKTINMPNNATPEDVNNAFVLAWKSGCKGVTVYRDGSKPEQVLSAPKVVRVEVEAEVEAAAYERESILLGFTRKVKTGLGSLYVTINGDDDGQPVELFATIGRAGTEIAAFTESLARMISLALRNDIPLSSITHQLLGIGGSNAGGFGEEKYLSVPDAIGKVLLMSPQILSAFEDITTEDYPERLDLCPECGQVLSFQEGCAQCPSCGYSRC